MSIASSNPIDLTLTMTICVWENSSRFDARQLKTRFGVLLRAHCLTIQHQIIITHFSRAWIDASISREKIWMHVWRGFTRLPKIAAILWPRMCWLMCAYYIIYLQNLLVSFFFPSWWRLQHQYRRPQGLVFSSSNSVPRSTSKKGLMITTVKEGKGAKASSSKEVNSMARRRPGDFRSYTLFLWG